MYKYLKYSILLSLIFVLSCSDDDNGIPQVQTSPNILFIIADDLGKDAISGYQEGNIKPNTPNIDNIRKNGLLFNNFWVSPTCTPTRSTIITGKYGYNTGVKDVGDILGSSETTLQQYINEKLSGKYSTAIIGKWHLSGNQNVNPESFGIDYYAGLIRGAVDDYYEWQLTQNGVNKLQNEYATTVFTDLSIDWIKSQSKPWFLWLAYNAPHTPFHVPPAEMHSQGQLIDYKPNMNATPYYFAAIEAMDYQIGRLLENIPENQKSKTIIIFIGDNGTPNQVAQSPYNSSNVKGTLYQGGINVPMFISGSSVTRFGEDNNLLSSVDLFSTIAQIAGVNTSEYMDSKSFKKLLSSNEVIREYQYSEQRNNDNSQWTISNGKYKLINTPEQQELYNLDTDPYESNNLLNNTLSTESEKALNELETELTNIRK